MWKGFKDFQTTIIIDLTKSEEELWNSLDKDARWGVKRAEKENLSFGEIERKELKVFYGIYKKTILSGGIAPMSLNEINVNSQKIFLCKKEGEIIAGGAIKIVPKQKKITLYLNASIRKFLKYQPNNFLYWNIILWGKGNNFEVFDLGGYQLNTREGDKLHSVNTFKSRWGGEIVSYPIYIKNPLRWIGRKLIRRFRFLFLLKKKITSVLDKSF